MGHTKVLLKGLDLFLFGIFSFMKSCLIPAINQAQIPETDISPIHWGLVGAASAAEIQPLCCDVKGQNFFRHLKDQQEKK